MNERARLTMSNLWLRGLAPRTLVREDGLTRLRPVGLTAWPTIVTQPNRRTPPAA